MFQNLQIKVLAGLLGLGLITGAYLMGSAHGVNKANQVCAAQMAQADEQAMRIQQEDEYNLNLAIESYTQSNLSIQLLQENQNALIAKNSSLINRTNHLNKLFVVLSSQSAYGVPPQTLISPAIEQDGSIYESRILLESVPRVDLVAHYIVDLRSHDAECVNKLNATIDLDSMDSSTGLQN